VRAFVVGGLEGRALDLARSLTAEGHAVRIVVDAEDGPEAAAVREAGAEPWAGTPDRIGTLRLGLEHVTILLWCLADADPAHPELHGSRLEMMLEKVTDTTVRGVVYELGSPHQESGLEEVETALRKNEIHFRTVERASGDWVGDVRRAIDELLTVDRMNDVNPFRTSVQ
jgi:hypothetical protein